MDERDCRILMELLKAPFDAYEAIGRRVGVTGTAVKARLSRLEEAGIFSGFACGPAPVALRRHGRLAVFAQGPAPEPERLLRVPEVAWAARAYPTASVAMLYRADPAEPVPAELEKAAGRKPDALVVPSDPREMETRPPLSPLDWRVMEAVMQEPRAPVRALAAATGLSARTVRERRDRMFAQGDLMTFPALDATLEEGAILYNAYLEAQSADALKGLRIGNAHRIVTHHEPPGTFLAGYVRTYAEAHVVEERLRATPGVKSATFSIPQGTLVARDRLAGWVRDEIAKWDKARRAPLAP